MGAKSKLDSLFETAKKDSGDRLVTLSEEARLRRAVERSDKIFRPTPEDFSSAPGAEARKPDLRIGLIASPVSYDVEKGQRPMRVYRPNLTMSGTIMAPYYQFLVAQSVPAIEAWRQALLDDMTTLVKDQNANLVCVSELGYPPPTATQDCEFTPHNINRIRNGDVKFRAKIQKLSSEGDALMLAGSFHDPSDFSNRAVLFAPNMPNPIEHRKLTTAKSPKIQEVIRTPSHPFYKLYRTDFGLVAVLICLDAYDLNMLCRYIQSGFLDRVEETPRIILVPACSPVPLCEACEDLSYYTRSIVVYTNGWMNQREPVYGAVYVAGTQVFKECEERVSFFDLPFTVIDKYKVSAYKRQSVNDVLGTIVR